MSTKNVVSIQIPEEELQVIKDAMATLKTTLSPYLIAITPSERQTIPKMSEGTQPFVEKALEYARNDAHFLPPYVDLAEMEKDWDTVKALMPILRDFRQLESNLGDTVMMAGSEAYVGALSYYNSVKYGARVNVADAKVIFEDLKKRFQKTTNSSSNGVEV